MIESSEKKTVFRYYDGANWVYCSYVDRYSDGMWSFSSSYAASEAVNVMDHPDINSDNLYEVLFAFKEDYNASDVDIVSVTVSIERQDLNDDQYRETKQRMALSKLSQGDIEALGLNDIAVYIKTKYH